MGAGIREGLAAFLLEQTVSDTPQATLAITVITAVVTYLAFRDPGLRDRLIFRPRDILANQEWHRMFTSALLHGDWMHFCLNFLSLYSFGSQIELVFGVRPFLFIYLMSILGGSLLSLVLHRNHDYAALGASGGVCGVIFASIFLLPGGKLQFYMIPIPIPASVYAIFFLVASYFGMRSANSNIGHDAHLGGALVGLFTTLVLYPHAATGNLPMLGAVLGVSAIIFLFLYRDPRMALRGALNRESEGPRGDERYQRYDEARRRNADREEMDQLLDKISAVGFDGLTLAEKQRLQELSKNARGGG